jgi:hypothetical protein
MATTAVNHLGVAFGHLFYTKAFEASSEAKLIAAEMAKHGLNAQAERSHVFTLFRQESLKSLGPQSRQIAAKIFRSKEVLAYQKVGSPNA